MTTRTNLPRKLIYGLLLAAILDGACALVFLILGLTGGHGLDEAGMFGVFAVVLLAAALMFAEFDLSSLQRRKVRSRARRR